MQSKTIGIIGCGFIGTKLAECTGKDLVSAISAVVLYDVDRTRSEALAEKLTNAVIADSMEDVVERSDLVVECASPKAVPGFLKKVIAEGKDAMVISIGGLLGNEDLITSAGEKGIRLILPSGAIAGIDALKSAKIAGIDSATLTTRKSPRSIEGAPYLVENNIDVSSLTGETVIFEGNALEAMKGFPQNINVSALLSLAGIGPEKTRVRIVISPEYTKNTHEVEIIGKSGVIRAQTENVPSPDNPKTSYLAALAAITALKEYFTTVRIGT